MNSLINWKKAAPTIFRKKDNPFSSLQEELNRVMKDFDHWFNTPATAKEHFENLSITPAVDIVEDKTNFKIEVEMPGLGGEDIKVSIHDNMVSIKGEKATSKKDDGKNFLNREITYGSYERLINLPDSADLEKAQASFKKGMLWITVPKKAESVKQARDLKIEKVE